MKLFIRILPVLLVIALGGAGTYINASSKAKTYYVTEKSLDYMEKTYDLFARRRMEALIELMNSLKDEQDELAILERVNNFFNQVPYKSDRKNWGVNDYWATRMEFLGKDAGDCEDYVIAKYFTLIQLGFPPEKLYFTYAKSKTYNVAHMVMTYFAMPKSVPLVLGNYNYKILPAPLRKDLVPILNFRGDQLYLAKQRGLGKQVPPGKKVTDKWNDMMQRIRSTEQ